MTPALDQADRLYTARFFLLLSALFAYMSGHGLLVHLAKYVVKLGGDVGTVSWIFGLGMLGSLLARPFVGRWVDRLGYKPVLLAATLLASLVIFSFQWFGDVRMICALRVAVQLSQAALLTAIAVFAARIAPPGRSAESLAMIGMGGLAGMMMGPVIGDVIFHRAGGANGAYTLFFTLGAVLMLSSAALVSVTAAPVGQAHPRGGRESFARLTIKHWPGPIVVMGLCLALVQTVPMLFIERFVIDRNLGGVTLFFVAYAPTAICLRIVLRRLPYRIGRRRTLILGYLSFVVGALLLTRVQTAAALIAPAIVMGAGHCFSYPFLIDLAAEKMPPQHRGVATSVILGVLDVGFLVSFVLVGYLIKRHGFNFALTTIAAVAIVGIAYYTWTQRHNVFTRRAEAQRPAVNGHREAA